MRILEPKEIDREKAEEKRLSIDEGLKIARRVDALREARSNEEASLRKFREESVKGIQAEMAVLYEKKSALDSEVRILEERKAAALIPLDAEWAKAKEERAKNESNRKAISEKESSLIKKDIELSQKEEEVRLRDIKSSQKEEHAAKALDESKKALESADRNLALSEQVKARADSYYDTKIKEVEAKEIAVAIREKDVLMGAESLEARIKALNDRERAINDKYATLQRAEKRIRNQNGTS